MTGAARGIGKEIALTLAKKGLGVGLCDISPEVKNICKEIEAMGVPAAAEVMDVSNETEVFQSYYNIREKLGSVDVLINNAGIGKLKSFIEYSTEEWMNTFSVNVHGAFLFSRSALPSMIEQRNGLVVNVASIWGLRGARGRSAYASTKHAMVGMSRCLADECRPYQVRVVALCPGNVLTDLSSSTSGEKSDWMHPSDVANIVGFLCDSRSQGIVGTTIEVDGWGKPPEFK
ncbi:SDR family NAD(P)-dependent oxidoreductase [Alteribacillus sp. YIM 98480]|uniref:SDR family NAD(P)-dependent oxidoreductase n=1 Tax=Alteribacillus sp. YIM 98480 TaxID=2606599 RepID=UPI00131C3B27|nr:SDR family oxidoreductase [Alteribacillus sp. YIM 98480]